MKQLSQKMGWQLGHRAQFADDHLAGWTYLSLYERERDPRMIKTLKDQFDWQMLWPQDESLEMKNQIVYREWAWCDALFMSPPTWAKLSAVSGDGKYLQFMNRLWWKTADYLYDKDEHLFYRDSRFFGLKEANGRRVFWARGNGWVVGGLTRVLEDMPEDFPDRPRYVEMFRAMCERLLPLQKEDGYWPSGLLDAAKWSDREVSGTAFFTYAFAWGINHGFLDRKQYLPAVERGWNVIVSAVHADGRIGWVQAVADRPGVAKEGNSRAYGSGGFLLAASEILKFVLLQNANSFRIEISNPLDQQRTDETIEIKWSDVASHLGNASADSIAVIDELNGNVLTTQVIDLENDGKPDQLLFQTSLNAMQKKTFKIAVVDPKQIPRATPLVFGRVVPERKDDFAWESDRIAFRMYGPALQSDNDASSGIDVWVKSTRALIINKWYKLDDYHKDHGEGLDAYKVGKGRGAGGSGVYIDNRLQISKLYTKARVIANGPIRVLFELEYAPWEIPGGTVSEVKRISLDAHQNLNRIESVFSVNAVNTRVPVAVGLALRSGGETKFADTWAGYWEPEEAKNGHIAVGMIVQGKGAQPFEHSQKQMIGNLGAEKEEMDRDFLIVRNVQANHPFVYYAGAGWSKNIDFPQAVDWFNHLSLMSKRIANPIQVRYVD
jgi:rhamnogalacturonyl hydrolase YesR